MPLPPKGYPTCAGSLAASTTLFTGSLLAPPARRRDVRYGPTGKHRYRYLCLWSASLRTRRSPSRPWQLGHYLQETHPRPGRHPNIRLYLAPNGLSKVSQATLGSLQTATMPRAVPEKISSTTTCRIAPPSPTDPRRYYEASRSMTSQPGSTLRSHVRHALSGSRGLDNTR